MPFGFSIFLRNLHSLWTNSLFTSSLLSVCSRKKETWKLAQQNTFINSFIHPSPCTSFLPFFHHPIHSFIRSSVYLSIRWFLFSHPIHLSIHPSFHSSALLPLIHLPHLSIHQPSLLPFFLPSFRLASHPFTQLCTFIYSFLLTYSFIKNIHGKNFH